MRQWDKLPDFMKLPEVRPYWEILNKKQGQLYLKRFFDLVLGILLFIILLIPMIIISILIKLDSKGPILYRQERVSTYGKIFRIHKFRTMVLNADKIGTGITVDDDPRITRIGKKLRCLRLDELPQVIDVIQGNMSFVGTRPESAKYVKQYKAEYYATLLMPAGITSEASIRYNNENKFLKVSDDVDDIYINIMLPKKMKWNLQYIKYFNFFTDILTMIRTILVVFGKKYD